MKTLWAVVLAAILLSYSNHFTNGFHFDDFHSVVNNPAIRDLHNLPLFFADARTISVLLANQVWRPVVVTSLAVDYRLAGGLQPAMFQASTFAWFLLQLTLLAILLRKILSVIDPGPWAEYATLFAVAMYGLHPALAETVNYICQRGEVFVGAGVVGGLALYAAKPELRRFGLYLLPVVLAMLSKPPALVFAPLLLLYVYLFETDGGNRWRRALAASSPSFATVGLMLWLHSVMTPKSFTPTIIPGFNYLITQPYAAARAFRTFFLPLWLSADSDLGPLQSLSDPRAVLGIVFLASVLATIWATAGQRQWRPVCFGLAWFVLGLIPTSVFPLSELENDHRLFLPFMGLALAVTWAAAMALKRLQLEEHPLKMWLPAAAVLVLSFCGHGTWMRNEVWRTEESLWKDVTQKSPANGRGWMNYGVALMALGRMSEAVAALERAQSYTPNYPLLEINLGVAYGALDRNKEAEARFLRAMALQPEDPLSYVYYGQWLARVGRNAQAIQILQIALAKPGDHGDAQAQLASLLAQAGKPTATDPVRAAREVAEKAPSPENYLNLSLALFRAQRFPETITAAEQALRLRPEYAEAYNNIGAAYQEMKDWDRAIVAAERASRINPGFELARNNLTYAKSQKAAHGK
jgi:tetratricopeptide (TPR) repeat protein